MTLDKMLADMRDAVRKLESIHAKHGKPPNELRIHPDDFEAIKRQAQPWLTRPASGLGDSIMGVRLVQDETAERLPRKDQS